MWNLKACVVCLSTETKLYNIDQFGLRNDYNTISSLNTYRGNGLPSFLCVECTARIKSFIKFRSKCHRANFVLQELLNKNNEIRHCDIVALNRESLDIMPSLSFGKVGTLHYEKIQFQWVKMNRISAVQANLTPTLFVSTIEEFDSQPSRKRTKSNFSQNVSELELDDLKQETIDYSMSFDDNEVSNEPNHNKIEVSSNSIEVEVPMLDDYLQEDNTNYDSDNDVSKQDISQENHEVDAGGDGSTLDEEYAKVFPLTEKEQKAVADIYPLFTHGKYKCKVCKKGYHHEPRLKIHMRMHEKHISGLFYCNLCCYYYKTEFLLKTHQTEKHFYKYKCTKCSEVSFDRTTAKQHYVWTHITGKTKKDANWYETRPSWIAARGGRRVKGQSHKTDNLLSLMPVKKRGKIPKDFLVYTPISHLEQYELIKERQKSKNYMESDYKCDLCYRGYREVNTFSNHLKKHDPDVSGPLQCDICKVYFKNTRKMYKHMIITHVFKYSCQKCKFICYNRGQAHSHYRWHKNVTYPCAHCDKEFSKSSTRLTHIRIKHPSTDICNICGHSFVSETGLCFHKLKAHSKEERDLSKKLTQDPSPDGKLYCGDCEMQFVSDKAFVIHLGSSNKHATVNLSVQPAKPRPAKKDSKKRGRPTRRTTEVLNNGIATATNCEECGKLLPNDVQARKHYKTEHPGAEFLKRYMCDVCGHTTQQYNNLLVHMRTHTNEKPYACPYCDRRFSMPSNRDRHLVVHTGEKRYECEHCHRRFTQSSAVKLHVQTVHLKIPYAPWDKKNRKRRKEAEPPPPAPPHAPPHPHPHPHGQYLNAYISYHDEGV